MLIAGRIGRNLMRRVVKMLGQLKNSAEDILLEYTYSEENRFELNFWIVPMTEIGEQ